MTNTEGMGMGETNSSGYRITCVPCLRSGKCVTYEGETGRNPYSRGLEHQGNLRNELEDSPLWKHCTLDHESHKVEFNMESLGGFRSCLDRQVNEAVRITATTGTILNSKNEFHQTPLTRLVAVSGLHGDQDQPMETGCRKSTFRRLAHSDQRSFGLKPEKTHFDLLNKLILIC
jgi:hypothetical protein